LPDCRNGFETVDGFDPVAAGSICAQRLFSASVILILQRRETPDQSSGLQSLTTASGEVARKPWTSTGKSPHLPSRDRRRAGLILRRQ
jgi:hypothetical protein